MSRQIMQLIVDFNSDLHTLYGAGANTIILDSIVYDAFITQFLNDRRQFCTTDKHVNPLHDFSKGDEYLHLSTSTGYVSIKRHEPYQKIGEGK